VSDPREPSERLLRLGQILSQQMSNGRGSDDVNPSRTSELQTERIRLLTLELQHDGTHNDHVEAVTMRVLLNDYAAALSGFREMARQAESHLTAALGSIRDARRYVKRQEKRKRTQKTRLASN
jgi:hypothetical protein